MLLLSTLFCAVAAGPTPSAGDLVVRAHERTGLARPVRGRRQWWPAVELGLQRVGQRGQGVDARWQSALALRWTPGRQGRITVPPPEHRMLDGRIRQLVHEHDELVAHPPEARGAPLLDQVLHTLRVHELEAGLDALTDGGFTSAEGAGEER
jgi:hypothetical protein